jgi:hypothetical protein
VKHVRYAWLIFTKRIPCPPDIEKELFMADLTKTMEAIAALSASADALIAKSQANADAAANATTDVATADQAAADQIAAVTDKLNTAAA